MSKYTENTVEDKPILINCHAEQALLGALITNPKLIDYIQDFLKEDDFYFDAHRDIYKSIKQLTEKELEISHIVLISALKSSSAFEELNNSRSSKGSGSYLTDLINLSVMVIDITGLVDLIFELSKKRQLSQVLLTLKTSVENSSTTESALSLIRNGEDKLLEMIQNSSPFSSGRATSSSLKDCMNDTLSSINKSISMNKTGQKLGITSGLQKLDGLLGGFQDSDLIVLAARPGMGKTAFALHFALSAAREFKARDENKNVLFFSLEMSKEQLMKRLISSTAEIDYTVLRDGKANEEEYSRIRKASNELSELNICINEQCASTVSGIRSNSIKENKRMPLGMLIIDYLHLIGSENKNKNFNKTNEITLITQGLKALAKELNVPILLLSQLSRNVESRDVKRPFLSDLKDSSSIEQDADIVMFLYREEYYLAQKNEFIGSDKKNSTDLIVAKHRNGSIGTISVHYDTFLSIIKDKTN